MSSPKAPKTPDPTLEVNAQTAANRYNSVGPNSSTSWDIGDRTIIGYDSKGNPQYGNQATQTVSLNPSEQRQLEGRNSVAESMIGTARDSAGELADPFSFNNQGSTAAKALYDRQVALMAPDIKMRDETFEDRMANSGIPVGSDAYTEALRGHENNKNFALNQASMQSEELGANLALQERQQRFAELAQALSGGTTPTAGTDGGNVDVTGAYQSAADADLAKYNARITESQTNNQAVMQGLMAYAMYAMSDERLKDDVEKVGEMPTGEGVYEYHYKWEDEGAPKTTGVMAQEIEDNYPEAVITTPSGYKAVNYARIAHAMQSSAAA